MKQLKFTDIVNKENIISALQLTIGAVVAAFAVEEFLVPNHIFDGGVTGISMILEHYLKGIPLGLLIVILNLPFMIFGILKLGKKFIFKAIYSIIIFSVMTSVFGGFANATGDVFLATIYGGVFLGAGVGLLGRALTGGGRTRQRELGVGQLMGLFMVTGAAAAVTGFLECIRYDMAAGSMCQGLELKAILAVLLGGAALKDGRAHPWRTAAGTLLVQGINAASGEFFSSRILLLIEGLLLLVLCIREIPSNPSGQAAPSPRRRVRSRRTGSEDDG